MRGHRCYASKRKASPVVAENQPRCTICGHRVIFVNGMPLHVGVGRGSALVLREPYPHEATVDPQPDRR